MDKDDMRRKVDVWFTYHPPTDEDHVERYRVIRQTARALALVIIDSTPIGPDQTAALRKLREVVMTANASIACEGV